MVVWAVLSWRHLFWPGINTTVWLHSAMAAQCSAATDFSKEEDEEEEQAKREKEK